VQKGKEMHKQRYEIEIEEILRKCEEQAGGDWAQADVRRVPEGLRDRILYVHTPTLARIDLDPMEEENSPPQRRPRRLRLTSGQHGFLSWSVLVVGILLYGYLPIVGVLLFLISVVLAVAAIRGA
jgi:hypothetical protein